MNRSVLVLAAVAVLAAGAAACSDETSGQATPGSGAASVPPGTPSSSRVPLPTDGLPTSGPSSTEPADTSPLASIDPCQLSAGVAAQLKFGNGDRDEIVGVQYCRYHATGSTLDFEFYLKVGLDDYVGGGGPVTSTQIGKHKALVAKEALGQCSVVLGVTDKSRADVVAGAQGDQSKSCELATQAATALEPSLPG